MTCSHFNVEVIVGKHSGIPVYADIGVLKTFCDGFVIFTPNNLIRFLNRPEFIYGGSYPFNYIDDFARCIGEYELRAV